MRRLLKIIGGFLLILILAAVSVPFLVPMDVLKGQAIQRIEAMTGRKVSMGAIKLSIFPNIALSADDVKIGNPAWVKGGGNMAEVKNLRIGVELMPLLKKDIHVTDLELKSPVIHLVKSGNQANWQLIPTEPVSKEKKEELRISPDENKKVSAPLRLDSLSISDGSLLFEDSASGTKHSLASVNMKLDSGNLPKSVNFKGDGVYNGTKANLTLTLGTPLELTSGTPSDIDLKAGYGALDATWKGTLSLKGGKPSITGTVNIPEIDTAALSAKDGAPAGKGEGNAPAPSGERWSSAPISMSGLNAANADITLEIGKLVTPKMTLNDVKARIELQGGALKAVLNELQLFSGAVTASVTANHSGAAGIKASLKNVQLEELLTTMANSKVLTGMLDGNIDLNATGNSQRALVSSLQGTGGFQMKDGSFRGGNLLNMTKNIATSFQGGQSKGEKTDFSSLSGTFNAKNGVFFNEDLNMDGPLLSLTGKGQIDLPEWQVHYLLTPKVITNHGSETQAASGISVPVQVEGSLDSPSYHPDLRGVLQDALKDPAKVKENLKDLKKNLNKDTLKNLLGR